MDGGEEGKEGGGEQGGGIKEGKERGIEAEKTKEEREAPGSGAGRRTEARVGLSNETEEERVQLE